VNSHKEINREENIMAEPFLGEIRIYSFDFAPQGWALCNGATLQIMQNQALYSLLMTTFGGDGKKTFGLPDLRGRVPMPLGINPVTGAVVTGGLKDGVESVALTTAQIPPHTHPVYANNANADNATPVTPANGFIWAEADDPQSTLVNVYAASANGTMAASAISSSGGGQAHNNMQPYLTVNYCIALTGYYPSRP
jgi:microcystin-dependent protein